MKPTEQRVQRVEDKLRADDYQPLVVEVDRDRGRGLYRGTAAVRRRVRRARAADRQAGVLRRRRGSVSLRPAFCPAGTGAAAGRGVGSVGQQAPLSIEMQPWKLSACRTLYIALFHG
jgi:hypothetical protein